MTARLMILAACLLFLPGCEDSNRETVRETKADQASQKSTRIIEVREAQAALQAMGYNPGPIDGVMGNRTAQALRDFQADFGLSVTGSINAESSAMLIKNIPAETSKPARPSSGNVAHDLLMSRSESERKQAFVTSVRVSGGSCQSIVTKSFFKGFDSENNAYWAVRCSNGRDYLIQVKPDATGSSRVMECSVARALDIDCWEKF